MTQTTTKISRNGQVSLPAEVRHRWHAPAVLVVDRGKYVIMRPIPDDPVAALLGAHAGPGPTTEAARASMRDEEAAADDRRQDRR